ncbi:MAG TPA: succinate--CoA ligase subunit alpha [Chloroflexota bacterium]|nr:succinate--CoA ligase subunit alpha [Chloroflexota bacterium]
MSILVDANTKVLVQGITGREGSFHAGQMRLFGTNVVAGVTPGKGGGEHEGVPLFDSVAEAMAKTGANASAIFVPPPFAADAILECAAAGMPLVSCITEGIPILDMVRVARYMKGSDTRLIGPNCPGITTPGGKCKIGIMPNMLFSVGNVGLISRSGTLTYEAVDALTRNGLGQTTCIGIGGDPIIGTKHLDALQLFEKDPDTKCVVMIGEIGGSDEETAAEFLQRSKMKVVGFISGRNAPPGKRMGHAGAIISGSTGTAAGKIAALEKAGVPVAATLEEIIPLVKRQLGQ